MEPVLPVAWLLIGGCALPALWGGFKLVMNYNINDGSFLAVFTKLLRERKLTRIRKLLMAVDHAPLFIFVGEALKLDLPRSSPRGISYRQQAPSQPYAERLWMALEPTHKTLMRKLNVALGATLLGILPMPLLWLFADALSPNQAHIIVAGVLAAIVLFSIRAYVTMRGAFGRAVEALAPLLEEGFHREDS